MRPPQNYGLHLHTDVFSFRSPHLLWFVVVCFLSNSSARVTSCNFVPHNSEDIQRFFQLPSATSSIPFTF